MDLSTLPKRFSSKLIISNGCGCWNWSASKDKNGYCVFRYNGQMGHAHRFIMVHFYGKLDKSQYVCHKCDNPSCCNPSHLYIGDALSNKKDFDERLRFKYLKRYCKNNHEFTVENTYNFKRKYKNKTFTSRACKICWHWHYLKRKEKAKTPLVDTRELSCVN